MKKKFTNLLRFEPSTSQHSVGVKWWNREGKKQHALIIRVISKQLPRWNLLPSFLSLFAQTTRNAVEFWSSILAQKISAF